jgi:hypothetical protein
MVIKNGQNLDEKSWESFSFNIMISYSTFNTVHFQVSRFGGKKLLLCVAFWV